VSVNPAPGDRLRTPHTLAWGHSATDDDVTATGNAGRFKRR